ncbi:hypothetical protein LG329_04535 [Virgibacillus necropolis]|uniref:hypothetical protein n=1 Tax=Virgibacillus necropolis TaxID=163877 RepID=UPI00384D0DC9
MFKAILSIFRTKVGSYVNNEKGAQALEWVALALVVLAVMGAIIGGLEGVSDASVGEAILNQITKLINKVGGE